MVLLAAPFSSWPSFQGRALARLSHRHAWSRQFCESSEWSFPLPSSESLGLSPQGLSTLPLQTCRRIFLAGVKLSNLNRESVSVHVPFSWFTNCQALTVHLNFTLFVFPFPDTLLFHMYIYVTPCGHSGTSHTPRAIVVFNHCCGHFSHR